MELYKNVTGFWNHTFFFFQILNTWVHLVKKHLLLKQIQVWVMLFTLILFSAWGRAYLIYHSVCKMLSLLWSSKRRKITENSHEYVSTSRRWEEERNWFWKRGDSGLTVYTLCLKCSLEIMKFFTQLNFGRIILNQGRSIN